MHESPRFTVPSPWPKRWWAGDPVRTAVGDTFSLFFPEGERGLVRTLRALSPEVKSAVGLARIDCFCREEGAHAREHERFLEPLAGSRTARMMRGASRLLFRRIARAPLRTRLAIGAAAEHAASSFARIGFELGLTDGATRPMRDLFEWHAREEILHREVLFDAYTAHGGGYALRIAAYAFSSTVLAAFFSIGTVLLLLEDRAFFSPSTWRSALSLTIRAAFRSSAARQFVHYLAPGFHPRHDGSDAALATAMRDDDLLVAAAPGSRSVA